MFPELIMDRSFMLSEGFDLFAISGIIFVTIFIFIPLFRWHNSRHIQAHNREMAKIHLDNARRLCEITDAEEELKRMNVFLYDCYPSLFLNSCVTLGDIGSSEEEIYRIRVKGRKSWAGEPLMKAYKRCVRPNLTV